MTSHGTVLDMLAVLRAAVHKNPLTDHEDNRFREAANLAAQRGWIFVRQHRDGNVAGGGDGGWIDSSTEPSLNIVALPLGRKIFVQFRRFVEHTYVEERLARGKKKPKRKRKKSSSF